MAPLPKIETQELGSVQFSNEAQRKKWLEEMKGKSLSVIFEDCNMLIIEMQLKDRRLALQLKHVNIEDQGKVVDKKVAEYNRFSGIAMTGISAGLGFVGAYYGQSVTGALFKTGSETAAGTKKHMDDQSQSVLANHDHVYQINTSIGREYSDRSSRSNQTIEQIQAMIAKRHDTENSSFAGILNVA